MFGILGFLFIIFLIIIIIGFSLIIGVLRFLFGFTKSKSRRGESSRQNDYNSQNENHNSNDFTSKKSRKNSGKKIFGKDEGEYIDFEEIDDK